MHPMASRLDRSGENWKCRTTHRAARMDMPEHDGRFHQFRRPHAQSRDYPEGADGAEHESRSKHEGEINHASLESFLHG